MQPTVRGSRQQGAESVCLRLSWRVQLQEDVAEHRTNRFLLKYTLSLSLNRYDKCGVVITFAIFLLVVNSEDDFWGLGAIPNGVSPQVNPKTTLNCSFDIRTLAIRAQRVSYLISVKSPRWFKQQKIEKRDSI